MKYGYARVSTDDQTTALQRVAFTKAGCKTIFKDERACQEPRRSALPFSAV
jgi:DNA invertase Pin-like site-specific DNA recombinase